ncbi:hypothetical protein GCM10010156_16240 [Planobispora rosea]|uniref:Uncharacterized protein n=1 Tax=Planobispora rosea TaxID=35762 RepID=A0A8J3WDF0_PLARO|nr:hypothetical protein [Planobispora rosea]GGS58335.1 hypothetical protein GCM10010156_16240 [Planobispora rosea]GIH84767.1 hypothetical protein Pro02_31750 [Planobispora rosea]
MKRWVALVAAVLIASVPVTAAPAAAQAAPADPVGALKRQFHPERGVHIAEVSRLVLDGREKESVRFRIHGRVQFGRSGPVASDATWRLVMDPFFRKLLEDESDDEVRAIVEEPIQQIVVGRRNYISGGLVARNLPQGKSWIRAGDPSAQANIASYQPIDVFAPAVLKTLLKGVAGKAVPGGFLYRGTISYKQLAEVSKDPSAKLLSSLFGGDGGEIAWRLWTDRTGLPTRLMTSQKTKVKSRMMSVQRTDTRYSDWGSHVVVVAPPADEVIDEKDLPRP